MGIGQNLKNLEGFKIKEWTEKAKLTSQQAARVSTPEGATDDLIEKLDILSESKIASSLAALVIGSWSEELFDDDSKPIATAMVRLAPKFPALRHMFFGDITYEECEISWLIQCDMGKMLMALHSLESFAVRGGQRLRFSKLSHDNLKKLVVQTGGLPKKAVQDIASAQLPALEHLELWLGEKSYGGDSTIKDLMPFLSGQLLPRLKYLGLRNSVYTDKIAETAAKSPVLSQIETFDLSMGTLSDVGAEALLDSPYVSQLKSLNLDHHYMSNDMMKKMKAKFGTIVSMKGQETPDMWDNEPHRYIECAE